MPGGGGAIFWWNWWWNWTILFIMGGFTPSEGNNGGGNYGSGGAGATGGSNLDLLVALAESSITGSACRLWNSRRRRWWIWNIRWTRLNMVEADGSGGGAVEQEADQMVLLETQDLGGVVNGLVEFHILEDWWIWSCIQTSHQQLQQLVVLETHGSYYI